jgi:hypothetical protein
VSPSLGPAYTVTKGFSPPVFVISPFSRAELVVTNVAPLLLVTVGAVIAPDLGVINAPKDLRFELPFLPV